MVLSSENHQLFTQELEREDIWKLKEKEDTLDQVKERVPEKLDFQQRPYGSEEWEF